MRAWPEVGREIDDFRTGRERAMHPRRRRTVRQRAEHERALLQLRVIVGDEPHVETSQTCLFAPALVGAGEAEVELRMARDEGAQLSAGITGRAEHPDGKFMHGE